LNIFDRVSICNLIERVEERNDSLAIIWLGIIDQVLYYLANLFMDIAGIRHNCLLSLRLATKKAVN